jgi:hypothetical protein
MNKGFLAVIHLSTELLTFAQRMISQIQKYKFNQSVNNRGASDCYEKSFFAPVCSLRSMHGFVL